MKRQMSFLFCIFLILLLTACGASATAPAASQAPAQTAESAAPAAAVQPVQTTEAPAPAYDLDLIQCSPTMIYAEVYHMMNEPEDYIGKLIRMEGVCASYPYPDHEVYGCIIADATACCKQGMEFVLAEDRPENYPAPGSEIVVSGRFNTYQAGEFSFCRLEACQIEYVISTPDSGT